MISPVLKDFIENNINLLDTDVNMSLNAKTICGLKKMSPEQQL